MGMTGVLQPEKDLNGNLSQVSAPNIQPISIVENGEYRAPYGAAYNPITVDVPAFVPQGNIEIIENGDYSVYDYETATVNVPGLVPTGTFSVMENGSYDITEYAGVDVDVEPSLQSKSRTYTPLESAQTETITADSGYYGLDGVDITVAAIQTETKTATPQEQTQQVTPSTGKYLKGVTVEAIDSHYVGSAIDRRTDVDVTVDGATVSTPNGYYAAGVTKSVQAGAEGVPQVVLGTVTNNAVEVTPTVTNIEGYIAGNTKTGSSVTVAASDLVSGTEDINENGVYDITNKASVNVAVPLPSGTKEISIIQNGVVTEDIEDYEYAEISVNVPNTYSAADEDKVVRAGALVSQTSTTKTTNGTYDTTVNNEVVVNVQPPLEQKTVTPTKQTQNVEPTAPNYGLSKVIVNPIPSEYIIPSGTENITQNGQYDITDKANANVQVPNTYTSTDEGKVVSQGSLVGQTSTTKTQNGTYDTTLNDEVVVNVRQPSGTKQVSIITNGTVTEDVTNYASAQITTAVPQMQRIILRPDAELWKSWTYDKRIVADEGVTIPAYQTTTVTLKATEQIDEITVDAANYKYFLTFRTLVIPEYNTDEIARGRYEWSSMVGAYEFVFTPMAELHPLVDGEYTIATNSASVQGGASYRSLYFTSSTGISIYATTAYGIWTTAVAPAYTGGKIKVNSPNFTMRAQANIFDQLYYEALTDIRFQYIYELWRVPIGSLQYDGWSNQQCVDKALDCLYSTNHKLT